MRLMGYRTVLSGKMHFVGPDQLHGFDERLTTDIYPADFAWTPNWDEPDRRIGKWYHNMDSLHEAGQAAMTYQIEYDEEVGFMAKRRIYDYARDSDPRPWMLVASFIHPHDPYVARPEWWDLYDHDDIDLPRRSRRARPALASHPAGHRIRHRRGHRGPHPQRPPRLLRQHQLLRRLARQAGRDRRGDGSADKTIVILTADHGDMLGERGQWFKMSMFERSARVPFIMAGPGIPRHDVPNACSHLDFLPTLLDIASGDGRLGRAGQPTRRAQPVAPGNRRDDDVDETTGEYCAEMTSYPIFMIRRGSMKYIHCDTDPPLLYDLAADPDETNNLADDPAYADSARRSRPRLRPSGTRRRSAADVLASQRARRTLHAAMTGTALSWDHEPVRDVANEYVRNHMDWAEAGRQAPACPATADSWRRTDASSWLRP